MICWPIFRKWKDHIYACYLNYNTKDGTSDPASAVWLHCGDVWIWLFGIRENIRFLHIRLVEQLRQSTVHRVAVHAEALDVQLGVVRQSVRGRNG